MLRWEFGGAWCCDQCYVWSVHVAARSLEFVLKLELKRNLSFQMNVFLEPVFCCVFADIFFSRTCYLLFDAPVRMHLPPFFSPCPRSLPQTPVRMHLPPFFSPCPRSLPQTPVTLVFWSMSHCVSQFSLLVRCQLVSGRTQVLIHLGFLGPLKPVVHGDCCFIL